MEVGGSPRDPYDEFWLLGALAVAPVLAWWAWSAPIVTGMFRLKLVELALIEAVGLGSARTAALASTLHEALAAPARISFDAFIFGLEAVGGYWRWPVAAGLLLLGGWLILGHPAGRYRRRFDLLGLAEAMQEHWPFALHALRRGNLHLPLDHPTWGTALSGPAFLQRHDLVEPAAGGQWTLRIARTQAALAAQLGEPWAAAVRPGSPAASLQPPHVRALAGIFALRAASVAAEDDREAERLKERAFALLRKLALAAAHHRAGDYLPPPAVCAQVVQETAPVLHTDAIQRVVAGHAYTSTVLLRLLAEARRGGVLPASLFNWLKGLDRPLWYALGSLGRRTPFAEALGAVAHYQAELQAGVALYLPAVAAAVAALQLELRQLPPASSSEESA